MKVMFLNTSSSLFHVLISFNSLIILSAECSIFAPSEKERSLFKLGNFDSAVMDGTFAAREVTRRLQKMFQF